MAVVGDITLSPLGDMQLYTNDNSWVSLADSNTIDTTASGLVELSGPGADIIINGVSLSDTLSSINDRLAILVPNPELEAEFEELAELRKQYDQLEKVLLEKKAMWDKLKG